MTPEELQQKAIKCMDDWPFFVREMLGITTNFPKQDLILESVRTNRRTAVRAPNGTGKTYLAAQCVLAATSLYSDCVVVTTAGAFRQVQKLWRDINRMHSVAPGLFGGTMLQNEYHIPERGVHAYGFATDTPARLESEHAKRILVILDEAKSIPEPIFEAADRLLTSGEWVRQLVLSSPGSPVGAFADCFGKLRELYTCFHIEVNESPFGSAELMADAKIKYGVDSPMYKSMILGDFAEVGGEPYVIPLSHILRNIDNPPEFKDGPLSAGLDLAAGGGDENVLAIMQGNKVIRLDCWTEADEMKTVGLVIEKMRNYGIPWENLFVDADGLGGPMVRRMEEQGFYPNRVYNGGHPFDDVQYAYANAEMWGTAARKIELGEVILLDDNTLVSQLSSRKKKARSDGRLQLESKEEAKRRGVHSPDRGDAVVMAMAGHRKSSLQIDNEVEDATDTQASSDDWLREHFRKAQEDADRQRRERGEPEWIP